MIPTAGHSRMWGQWKDEWLLGVEGREGGTDGVQGVFRAVADSVSSCRGGHMSLYLCQNTGCSAQHRM